MEMPNGMKIRFRTLMYCFYHRDNYGLNHYRNVTSLEFYLYLLFIGTVERTNSKRVCLHGSRDQTELSTDTVFRSPQINILPTDHGIRGCKK